MRVFDFVQPDYDKPDDSGEIRVKVICLGDSAVGKSKYAVFFGCFEFFYTFV